MDIERFSDAGAFLQAGERWLLRAEAENALILGVAHALTAGAPTVIPPYFVVAREGAELLGAAFQSIPGKVGMTRMERPEASDAVARDIHAACPVVDMLIGPEPSVGAVAARLAALRGGRAHRAMAQRIHALRAVQPVPVPPGRLRPAGPLDAEALIPWTAEFLRIADERSDPAEAVHARIAGGMLFVWDDSGPVSMAAWTGKTPTGVRVAFVYTPPERRRNGYATAAVAELSRLLLEQGNQFCCLYTDLANPTSNAIYARIGYRPVADSAAYQLELPRAGGGLE